MVGPVPAALWGLHHVDTPGGGSSVPADFSIHVPTETRAWPASGSTGLPAACSPIHPPGLSSAWPAAPREAQGWGMGKPPPPAWGLPEPLPTLKKGLSHPAPAVQPCTPPHPRLYSGRTGSGAMPAPIKPARGIKVRRMQLCLLDLTRPERRFLQPEFTAP